jgi:hypothetical protein
MRARANRVSSMPANAISFTPNPGFASAAGSVKRVRPGTHGEQHADHRRVVGERGLLALGADVETALPDGEHADLCRWRDLGKRLARHDHDPEAALAQPLGGGLHGIRVLIGEPDLRDRIVRLEAHVHRQEIEHLAGALRVDRAVGRVRDHQGGGGHRPLK